MRCGIDGKSGGKVALFASCCVFPDWVRVGRMGRTDWPRLQPIADINA